MLHDAFEGYRLGLSGDTQDRVVDIVTLLHTHLGQALDGHSYGTRTAV